MHLILIGMPGAGKSTLAGKLAQHLKRPHTDTDWELEKRAGCSIAALIEAEGEGAFRALEAEVLLDVLEEAPQIIATGGGLPIQPGAMQKLLSAGLVVYLEIEPEVAIARLEVDKVERKHLAGNVSEKWAALFAQRKDVYEQAHVKLADTEQALAFLKAWLA